MQAGIEKIRLIPLNPAKNRKILLAKSATRRYTRLHNNGSELTKEKTMSLDNIAPSTGSETQAAPPAAAESAVLTIAPAAAAKIGLLLGQKQPRPEALMVSVKTRGCSGMAYDLQFLDKLADRPQGADVISQHGVTVVVDPKAALYITGTVMDYRESPTQSGFTFKNPNETGRCGCGESFMTGKA